MRHKLLTLQAGRAIAALAVVVGHGADAVSSFVQPLPPAVRAVTRYGYLGVDFFFVLSGFIIYFTNANKSNAPGWGTRYIESRLARVFVPYLPVAIVLGLGYTLAPSFSASDRTWGWLSTLTLIPTAHSPALSPAWTLQHELTFYFLMLVLFRLRIPILGLAIWAAVILLVRAFLGFGLSVRSHRVEDVFLHPINLEFLFGACAAWCVMHGRLGKTWPVIGLSALSFALFAADGGQRQHSILFGLGVAFFVLLLVRSEEAGRVSVGRAGALLGAASYAIYLVHKPLISLAVRPLHYVPVLSTWWGAMILMVSVSVAAGIAYHLVYEVRALDTVRSRIGKRSAFR